MAIVSVNPSLPVIAAPSVGGASDGLVLQPGTVIPAQVQDVLAGNLVRIAIASLSLEVLTEVALTPGQNLQLAVSQPQDGVVRLQIVGQGATAADVSASNDATSLAPGLQVAQAANPANVAVPANDPLTPLERIAVSVAAASAATGQQGLSPLFANLSAVASSNTLPPALQQAIGQVLAQQTSLDENLSGADVQNAVQTSGLFLESTLASEAAPPQGSVPDLKAALIVLRQTLASAVTPSEVVTPSASAIATDAVTPSAPAVATEAATPSAASPPLVPSQSVEAAVTADSHLPQLPAPLPNVITADPGKLPAALPLAQALLGSGARSVTSGAALNLLQEALQEIPHAVAGPAATATSPNGANVQSGQRPTTASTPPPPFRGALPSAQPVATSSIAPNAPLATTVHHLIDDTDAAIARQTLLQIASLPDRSDPSGNRIDASVPRWNFEIPFATPQGTAMAQFEISRDGGGQEVEAAKRSWQARFSLNIEPAGPVHALISLTGDRASVRMWAERPQTAAQLRAGAGELSQALSQADLSPGDIVIREGAPPQPAPAKAGHFLDRAL